MVRPLRVGSSGVIVSRESFTSALRSVGLAAGDTLVLHSQLFSLGRPSVGLGRDALVRALIDATLDVLNPGGALLLPTFTFSFCSSGKFSPADSRGEVGLLGDVARQFGDSWRTHHPI